MVVLVNNLVKSMIEEWGLVKNKLFQLNLSYSDSNNHFKFSVYRALTFKSIRPFLSKIKKLVKLCKTRYLRLRTNLNPSF